MSSTIENYQLDFTTRKEALDHAKTVLERCEVFGKLKEEQPYQSTTAQYILAEVLFILSTRYKTINYLYCAISWIRAGQERVAVAIGIDPTSSNMLHFDNVGHLRPASNMLEMALFDVELKVDGHRLALEKLEKLLNYSEFVKKHISLKKDKSETYDDIVKLAEATLNYKGNSDYQSLLDITDETLIDPITKVD